MTVHSEFRERLLETLDDRMAAQGFQRRRHVYVRWTDSGVAHAVSIRMERYEPGPTEWNLRYSSYGEIEVDVGVYSRAMARAEGDEEVRSFPVTAWQVSRELGEFIGLGIHHRWPLVGDPSDLADELWGLLAAQAMPWLDGLPDDEAIIAGLHEDGDRRAWHLQALLHLDRGETDAAAAALQRYLDQIPDANRDRLAGWFARKYELDLS